MQFKLGIQSSMDFLVAYELVAPILLPINPDTVQYMHRLQPSHTRLNSQKMVTQNQNQAIHLHRLRRGKRQSSSENALLASQHFIRYTIIIVYTKVITVKVHFSAHEKIMPIGQNWPLEKFTHLTLHALQA